MPAPVYRDSTGQNDTGLSGICAQTKQQPRMRSTGLPGKEDSRCGLMFIWQKGRGK